MSPTAAQVRSLMRQYMRLGRDFPNYNIKHYLLRKAREEPRRWAAASGGGDAAAADAAWAAAAADLEAFRRQAAVYGMYGRRVKNVLEVDHEAAARKLQDGGSS